MYIAELDPGHCASLPWAVVYQALVCYTRVSVLTLWISRSTIGCEAHRTQMILAKAKALHASLSTRRDNAAMVITVNTVSTDTPSIALIVPAFMQLAVWARP